MKQSKIKKFIFGASMSLLLILPVVPVHAETNGIKESISVTDVQPRAAICPQCRIGRISTKIVKINAWHNSSGSSSSCTHGYIYGYDIPQTRTIDKKNTCSNVKCTYEYNFSTTETRRLCYGRYNP